MSIDAEYRDRLETMLAVDEMVAALVQTLEETGQLDNTFIFFTSDNGYHLGQHRLIGKDTTYEEDIRVPLIVRGPGVPAGQTVSHFALNSDLAPTLAELAGASAPAFIDGRSLVPVLSAYTAPIGKLAAKVSCREMAAERGSIWTRIDISRAANTRVYVCGGTWRNTSCTTLRATRIS